MKDSDHFLKNSFGWYTPERKLYKKDCNRKSGKDRKIKCQQKGNNGFQYYQENWDLEYIIESPDN